MRWSKGVRAYIRIQSRKLANVGLGTKKVPTLRKQSDGVKRCVCVLKLGGYVESPNLIFNEKDVPKPAAWNLKSQLAEIAKVERDRVKERQFFAGITKPLKTGFRRALDRELDAALETLWRSGPRSRDLYIKIGKGLAAMTHEDLFCVVSLIPKGIEALAPSLTNGKSLLQIFVYRDSD